MAFKSEGALRKRNSSIPLNRAKRRFHLRIHAAGVRSVALATIPVFAQDFNGFIHLLINTGAQQEGVNPHHYVWRYSFPFGGITFRRVPAENWQTQPVAASNFKLSGPRTFPAFLLPTIVASRLSAAKLVTISAALFVHSFTSRTILL